MRIEQALERFLTQLEADGRSVHTRMQYARHARLFAHWARHGGHCGAELEKLGHEDVAAFLASAMANSRARGGQKLATSQNCLRSSLKGFFAYLHRAGYLAQDLGRLIRRARCSPSPPRALSEEDQTRLLVTLAKAKGPEAERDHLLVHLMLATGIRIGSAVFLNVEDVNLDKSEILLTHTKGDRPDTAFLGLSIRKHLRRYLARRSPGPLFTGRGGQRVSVRHVQRRLTQWMTKAGIKQPASAHTLRHAFAMRIYRSTGDILLVKEALRHRSIGSTLAYTRVDDRRLREVLAGRPPAGAARLIGRLSEQREKALPLGAILRLHVRDAGPQGGPGNREP